MIRLTVVIAELGEGSLQVQRIPQPDGVVTAKERALTERLLQAMTDETNQFGVEHGHEPLRKVVHHKLNECLGGS